MTTREDVIKELVEKTQRELAQPKQPLQRSRIWKNPEGYKYLVQWSNTVLLRFLVRKFTDNLPKSEYRRKAQLDDAGRSTVRNIEEGYKRSTTAEYLQFIGYSQGSLEEVKGDVRELTEDGFLQSKPGSSLADLGINLGNLNKTLRSSNNPLKSSKNPLKDSKGKLKDVGGKQNRTAFLYRPLTILYPPLKNLRAQDLTYEIFIELINKTDWLLRKLVESLERKLSAEQKGYRIEQARIGSKLRL
ncbi:MAG: four helix bundle protein [Candidatus Blackburnbacteria bacterium]|nr:four helix bundle protein [Candidatus Blackburnbacteria bacterium]